MLYVIALVGLLHVAAAQNLFLDGLACTTIGCGPAPSANCSYVQMIRPNGIHCEPECPVCMDQDESPACTEIAGCRNPDVPIGCMNYTYVYPNGPGCQPACPVCLHEPAPPICTEVGCISTAGPFCRNVRTVYPNGKDCPPACKVCDDDQPEACTANPCWEPTPQPYCKNIVNTYPNGPNCSPACPKCMDDMIIKSEAHTITSGLMGVVGLLVAKFIL